MFLLHIFRIQIPKGHCNHKSLNSAAPLGEQRTGRLGAIKSLEHRLCQADSACSIIIDGIMSHFPPLGTEILTPSEMGEADRLTIASGISGQQLMDAAGYAIADAVLANHPDMRRAVILCGPGNNGGDGYVAARLLKARGVDIVLFRNGEPKPGTDASQAAALWHGASLPLGFLQLKAGDVVIDALYGAGFKGKLKGEDAQAVEAVNQSGLPVIAVDLPSGLDGQSGQHQGVAIRATRTVTFFRKKPGHLLFPGRCLCGEVIVADIGISPRTLAEIGVQLFENSKAAFAVELPRPFAQTHKYKRGMAGIFTGDATATGAARLSAAAAQRAGAGAVTLLAPDEALATISAHVTSVMMRSCNGATALKPILADAKFRAFVIGPGFGRFMQLKEIVLALLAADNARPLVLDADVFSAFALEGETLFAAIKACGQPVILTPHEGEFARVFADLARSDLPKHEKARQAAARAQAVIILKGADTVIAAPDGRAAINSNGRPDLATAGSGDVLAGFAGGLIAQGMPAFEAACAAVWYHGEAGNRLGHGAVAEELATEIGIDPLS